MSEMVKTVRIRNFIDGAWEEDPAAEYEPLYKHSTGEVIGEVLPWEQYFFCFVA